MSATMQNGQFIKAVLWMLAIVLVAAGLVVDHKYGGFRGPADNQPSGTIVMPNASSPT